MVDEATGAAPATSLPRTAGSVPLHTQETQ
jgi:hypothetical protein